MFLVDLKYLEYSTSGINIVPLVEKLNDMFVKLLILSYLSTIEIILTYLISLSYLPILFVLPFSTSTIYDNNYRSVGRQVDFALSGIRV